MFLVTAGVPADALSGGAALDARIRRSAVPEDRLEHVHVLPSADGGALLTLFLGHPDSTATERAAARLVASALPPATGARLDWTPAVSLVSVLQRLRPGSREGPHDRELPPQEPDTQ